MSDVVDFRRLVDFERDYEKIKYRKMSEVVGAVRSIDRTDKPSFYRTTLLALQTVNESKEKFGAAFGDLCDSYGITEKEFYLAARRVDERIIHFSEFTTEELMEAYKIMKVA